MKGNAAGFGLIELMLALTLGLILVLGATQIFLSAKSTAVSQNASAALQEDARFVLSKMLQEIRMVGMFGCVKNLKDSSAQGDFAINAQTPIAWDSGSQALTLVGADVGEEGGRPDWTVLSDCVTQATAYSGAKTPAPGQLAIPVRKRIYSLRGQQIFMRSGRGASQALVNNVSAFEVSFGVADLEADSAVARYTSEPLDPALIRSVRLTLTLSDPKNRVRSQTFNGLAALRNRLP
jgi:type IV pilus assembly protein PilW